ncbi:MAG: ferrous iron transport protein A [Anaerolineales bacterium]|nr:ferrous iron transport protein A [Anaerolineales bacterium]
MKRPKFGLHFGGRRRKRRRGKCPTCNGSSIEMTLKDVPVGCRARVVGFCPGLAAERLAYLQAYGLAPGYWVRVLQHSPVTVIEVEHTELALESELACEVLVMEDGGN